MPARDATEWARPLGSLGNGNDAADAAVLDLVYDQLKGGAVLGDFTNHSIPNLRHEAGPRVSGDPLRGGPRNVA